ncbi:ribonuclease P protein component [Hyphomonas polymorpha PS728]|uniref:Ribonuclease P protein component n=1 Tax=Hyphomonas polymorpha PS728 TaxID=1280954 RepID=A0A062VMZ3_9PROT|nr:MULTISPECIES: ribonuclease P protein component [Hyphomonas]AXE62936.1 ribonuclease P protein component [Hyphomonas sp. CACIAM 19H1]KDA00085.1 ribonuclease P protein component [Hyphomonas polymorpha PS728]
MSPDLTPMPELRRLRRRREFTYVRDGITERRKTVVVQARARPGDETGDHVGEGYTATKKVGGAVERNRAKRRLREAARRLLAQHGRPGWDYVFIAREATLDTGWARLLDDMESALISLART